MYPTTVDFALSLLVHFEPGANDHLAEEGAIKAYNAAIVVAGEVADFATREILEDILRDEDRHIDKIEELQDQIDQMSIQVFLSSRA